MMRKLVLELSPSEAELILRGLKRVRSYLVSYDNGTVTKRTEQKECAELIGQLERLLK